MKENFIRTMTDDLRYWEKSRHEIKSFSCLHFIHLFLMIRHRILIIKKGGPLSTKISRGQRGRPQLLQ